MSKRKVTDSWLQIANHLPFARAMAIGAVTFLLAHGIAEHDLKQAEQRGETVSTVFKALDKVGQQVAADRIGGRIDDLKVVNFWQNEIRRAADNKPSKPVIT